ncbi:MAG: CRISPR-associated endonuclease Cas1 [Bacteroidetes bacterium]|nr:CRISPR-associated endonuclease Cas1 [Bacteroidota bacterium]
MGSIATFSEGHAPFPELLPARMVNEYVYCPRLSYLMWVQGEWAASSDTVEGTNVHRRVDQRKGKLPKAEDVEGDTRIHARSITLSSEGLGLIAKLDLVEGEKGEVTPVDYKRGKRPHVEGGVWEPERVQLALQVLLLREHGYSCTGGIIYFVASKERVPVPVDKDLERQALQAVADMRAMGASGTMPPPLVGSPKCPRCSLVGICMPDELNFAKERTQDVRPLAVERTPALPLYVQAHHGKVAKSGETLVVEDGDGNTTKVRLADVNSLVILGNVYVTTPTLHELMQREVPINWHGYGGWFMGHTTGTGHKNVELRTAQYKASFDEAWCLRIAQGLVAAKIANARTLLRRNWKDEGMPEELAQEFKQLIAKSARTESLGELLGIEGAAAAKYFAHFARMFSTNDEGTTRFDFNGRNRRPPADPVNALLSFGYAMLTRTWHQVLSGVGFDPYRGFYHQPRYGRPALALDLMEPFRPLIVDSTVIQVINNGEVAASDFMQAGPAVNLNEAGRKAYIAAFERRLSQEVTHPVFGYQVPYRTVLELQARLLGRHLLGELEENPNFTTR